MKIILYGNCQLWGIKECLFSLTNYDTEYIDCYTQNNDEEYMLNLGDRTIKFKTIETIKERTNIEFQELPDGYDPDKINDGYNDNVHSYGTDAKPFNGVWSLTQQAPIFTKENNSKSWFAAGWYVINQNNIWRQEFCPKLIAIQRYDYRGPFKEKEKAREVLDIIKGERLFRK